MNLIPFKAKLKDTVFFGDGTLNKLGELANDFGFKRPLLVADRGLVNSGHVQKAIGHLEKTGCDPIVFDDFKENPDSLMVSKGKEFAGQFNIDSIIGLGGGSSLDCAKGINFLLTNGGCMQDYRGYGKASKNFLPMIGVPTTAGTGSEAQSYALITDNNTNMKMACGDPKAIFNAVILDPVLTLSQPIQVSVAAGFDAISHAIESYVSTQRNSFSEEYSCEAWRILQNSYTRMLENSNNLNARAGMLLGAHFAGVAIENSMLGASHACANPLTCFHGITHGVAIGILLPKVVRWNMPVVGDRYHELIQIVESGNLDEDNPEELACQLEEMVRLGNMPSTLGHFDIFEDDLSRLASAAAKQWTGQFNPRAFDRSGALEVYRSSL